MRKKAYALVMLFSPMALFAATDFQTGMGKAMGIGAIVAFCGCVIFGIEGIFHWRNGNSYGKDIIGVVLCAAAFAIAGAIFAAFGLSDAVVDPQF
jgi:hypothetical protein